MTGGARSRPPSFLARYLRETYRHRHAQPQLDLFLFDVVPGLGGRALAMACLTFVAWSLCPNRRPCHLEVWPVPQRAGWHARPRGPCRSGHVLAHLLSGQRSNDGPVPTEFAFEWPAGVAAQGNMNECTPIEEYDPTSCWTSSSLRKTCTGTKPSTSAGLKRRRHQGVRVLHGL